MIAFNDLKEYIDQIAKEKKKYGDSLQSSAGSASILKLKAEAQEFNEYNIPEAYLSLLLITNGIDHNGYVLYADKTQTIKGYSDRNIEGFIDANKLWKSYSNNNKHTLIMYGETGMSLYIHNRKKKQFEVIDRVSGDSYLEYDSLEKLLERLLKDMLEIHDE